MKKTFNLKVKKKQVAKIDEELAEAIIEIFEEKLDVITTKNNKDDLKSKKKDSYKKLKRELLYEIADLIYTNRRLFMENKT